MVNILTIKSFDDNYIWLIKDAASNHCIVVDPGDAAPVLEMINQQELILDAILLTHHHHDHTGGVKALQASLENEITIYSQQRHDQQTIQFFDDKFALTVMAIPGHTLDHIAFYNDKYLFCGDTLFSGGCGRVFEGTHAQMFDSLSKLRALNDETQVYCAHEYTQNNLIFALDVEPSNQDLIAYVKQVAKMRQQGLATIPTTINKEKAINPFFRYDKIPLKATLENKLALRIDSPLACFTELRRYKDNF